MGHLQYIPSFYFYKFANAVSAPYTSLNAYRSGAIDESGNITGTEGSIDDFEYFVIKLKKIFEHLPPGITKSRLTNVSSIMQLFSEGIENIGVTQEQVICLIEAHVTLNSNNEVSFIELLEDMGTGAMSTGTAPGDIGVPYDSSQINKGNVSGYDPRLGEIMTRNQPVNMFQGIEMFNVSPQEFKTFKQSKAWRHLPDSPTKKYLQRFQRRNKEGKMAVRDESNGEIFFVPYKEKTFMEEFGLESLSVLKEVKDVFVDRDEFEDIANRTGEEKVDPSPEGVKEVLSAQKKAAEDAKKANKRPAEQFERQASLDASKASMGELEDLVRSSDSSDRRLASNWLTIAKHFSRRSTSSTAPYDGVLLGRNAGGRISPLLYDAKTARWSAVTEVPDTSELVSVEPEDDPFNLWASAVEHGGNVDFEENPEQIARANELAKKMQKSPKFQTNARELAATKAASKYPVMTNLLRGRIFTPKQIGEILQGGVGNLKGREFRPNRLGRSVSGLRVGPYREALGQYERSMETWEKENPETRGPRPIPPKPVTFRPSISTASNALTISDLQQMENVPGKVYVPTPEDVQSAMKMIGKDVYERLFKS